MNICVFCSSAEHLRPSFLREAAALGAQIAARGHRLVYGGGDLGLMGAVARATVAGGGRVLGVMPRVLVDRGLDGPTMGELVVTETLRERKAIMDREADAFVALPGGFGTLEELVEVVTLRQLGVHARPVVVMDVDGYWAPLRALAAAMVGEGLAPAGEGVLFDVASDAASAIALVEAGAASTRNDRGGSPFSTSVAATGGALRTATSASDRAGQDRAILEDWTESPQAESTGSG